jgi:hypothetical protein
VDDELDRRSILAGLLATAASPSLAWSKTMLSDKHFAATIVALPHSLQPYDTCGDWQISSRGPIHVSVSEMADWRYELLVGLHELVEASLCKARGIDQHAVTAFDVEYEKKRRQGDESEPGDDSAAPYHLEHVFATKIEKLMCAELGLDWAEYDKAVGAL